LAACLFAHSPLEGSACVHKRNCRLSARQRLLNRDDFAYSDEAARVYRTDVARRSNLMAPTSMSFSMERSKDACLGVITLSLVFCAYALIPIGFSVIISSGFTWANLGSDTLFMARAAKTPF